MPKFLIISDIHAHLYVDGDVTINDKPVFEKRKSQVFVGRSRKNHPIESISSVLAGQDIDFLFCPGDLGDNADKYGIVHAFQELELLKHNLKINESFYAVGNHDVRSYDDSEDHHSLVNQLETNFPTQDKDAQDHYWEHGFCLVSLDESFDLLILNSSKDHTDKEKAKSGKFNKRTLKSLEKFLEKEKREKFIVTLVHHQPIQSSVDEDFDTDCIEGGDKLLNLLVDHKCKLIIHGHLHVPFLKRHNLNGQECFIFSAGALGILLEDYSVETSNCFHILDLDLSDDSRSCNGTIETWEYHTSWNKSKTYSNSFPHLAKFGEHLKSFSETSDEVLEIVEERFSSDDQEIYRIPFSEIEEAVPNVNNFIPDELQKLKTNIETSHMYLIKSDDNGKFESVDLIHRS